MADGFVLATRALKLDKNPELPNEGVTVWVLLGPSSSSK